MLVIGKSHDYFTLWEKTVSGKSPHTESTYVYQNNISQSLDEVRKIYPDVEYFEWLRGTGTYKVNEDRLIRILEPGILFFGTYRYYSVETVPVSYLIWLLENFRHTNPEEYTWWIDTLPMIKELVSEAGYFIIDDEDFIWVTAKDNIKTESELPESLLQHRPVDIVVTDNPDEDGYIYVENVCFKFPEVKKLHYNSSYLPVLNKRRRKIKHKSITISDYNITQVKNSWGSFSADNVYNRQLYIDIKKWTIN